LLIDDDLFLNRVLGVWQTSNHRHGPNLLGSTVQFAGSLLVVRVILSVDINLNVETFSDVKNVSVRVENVDVQLVFTTHDQIPAEGMINCVKPTAKKNNKETSPFVRQDTDFKGCRIGHPENGRRGSALFVGVDCIHVSQNDSGFSYGKRFDNNSICLQRANGQVFHFQLVLLRGQQHLLLASVPNKFQAVANLDSGRI
jgi:hypothetical protein